MSDAAAYKAEAIKRFDALDEYVRHGELGRGVSELQQTSEKLMRLARRHEQTLQDNPNPNPIPIPNPIPDPDPSPNAAGAGPHLGRTRRRHLRLHAPAPG